MNQNKVNPEDLPGFVPESDPEPEKEPNLGQNEQKLENEKSNLGQNEQKLENEKQVWSTKGYDEQADESVGVSFAFPKAQAPAVLLIFVAIGQAIPYSWSLYQWFTINPHPSEHIAIGIGSALLATLLRFFLAFAGCAGSFQTNPAKSIGQACIGIGFFAFLLGLGEIGVLSYHLASGEYRWIGGHSVWFFWWIIALDVGALLGSILSITLMVIPSQAGVCLDHPLPNKLRDFERQAVRVFRGPNQ